MSGLIKVNPRSESRRSSWRVNQGLEANSPTRKTNYTRIFRPANQESPELRTVFLERIPAKFSSIKFTVDRMDGSKNSDTCLLYTGRDVNGDERGWRMTVDYPVNINFPAWIPCFGSLSLGEPNLTKYCGPLSSENTLFRPSSNFWAKAAISSGVLNIDPFNLSGCG